MSTMSPGQPLSPADQRLWATLVHIGGILFSFVAPLIGYLLLRERGMFVRDHTRSALNFQITLTLASIAGGILTPIGIGFIVIVAVPIVSLVFGIIAAVAANRGQHYRYPLAIEFIKR